MFYKKKKIKWYITVPVREKSRKNELDEQHRSNKSDGIINRDITEQKHNIEGDSATALLLTDQMSLYTGVRSGNADRHSTYHRSEVNKIALLQTDQTLKYIGGVGREGRSHKSALCRS